MSESAGVSGGEWYFARGGERQGPVSWDDLRRRARAGQIAGDDLVWSDGMPDWMPASNVAGLFPPGSVLSGGGVIGGGRAGGLAGGRPATETLGYQAAGLGAVRYAGLWKRFVAAVVDGILLGIAGLIMGGLLGLLVARAEQAGDPNVFNGLVVANQSFGLITAWLYAAFFESGSWQATPGKRLMRLKVVDYGGMRISFARATGRHFAKTLSYLTLLIGFIMIAFTARKQGLHDLIAGTLVLHEPKR